MPSIAILPIFMLIISNVFMTFAWYGHLKFPQYSLWAIILVSWAIALIEYCFAVPANRMGYTYFTAAELKTIQEVITLAVFMVFSVLYLGEKMTMQHFFGFGLIALGAYFVFNAPKTV